MSLSCSLILSCIDLPVSLSTKDASEILEKISCNTKRLFNKTRDRQKRKFDNLLIEKQSSVSMTRTPVTLTEHLKLTNPNGLSTYPPGPGCSKAD